MKMKVQMKEWNNEWKLHLKRFQSNLQAEEGCDLHEKSLKTSSSKCRS
jgi:hypothetical protein